MLSKMLQLLVTISKPVSVFLKISCSLTTISLVIRCYIQINYLCMKIDLIRRYLCKKSPFCVFKTPLKLGTGE